MIDTTQLTNLISAFRVETEKESILLETVGSLLQTITDLLANPSSSIVTRTVQISLTNPSASPSIADFMLKYGSMKLTSYRILSMRYNSTSMTKLYFENGVQGPTPYRYNLTSAKVTFEINASVIEEISRETFNTGSAEVIDFFERTVMSIIDDVTPYMIYYFMLKSNFIIQRSEFTGT